jgi:transcriptional regulator with XRE-family HTH domain
MDSRRLSMDGGRLLALLRRKAGLTQVELAKQAVVSRSMIGQIEIGERQPSRKLLRRLCDAMNLSEEDERQLVLAYEFRPPGETPEQIEAFLRADKNLAPDQAERIANLVREAYEKALSE